MTFYLTAAAALVVAVAPAAAQVPATSSDTTLITLGTAGGPLPRPDRAQSSNLLVVNGALYLVDAGGGVTGRLVESGYNFRNASKIFITHIHSDDTDGLATLLNSQWEYQPREPTDIFGSGVERNAARSGRLDELTPRNSHRAAPKAEDLLLNSCSTSRSAHPHS